MREQRMVRELEIASNIQRAMLPTRPQHPDFEFAGKMLPADEVGGDFFDVLVSERKLWITVGDVSGHGLGAGLIMLMAQSAFASQFRAQPSAVPNSVMSAVNELLWENITERLRENKYVTCQLLAYRDNGVFRVAGGHQFPLVYRAITGQIERIHVAGPWLGILRSWPEAPSSEVQLEPGDVLCLYTDGSIEARNEAGELWDTERFSEALREGLSQFEDMERAIDHVFGRLFEHCPKPDDDVSLLLVRRRPLS
jgi:sigma-B regulation protein RsbU (phosphoserine phosphatase)